MAPSTQPHSRCGGVIDTYDWEAAWNRPEPTQSAPIAFIRSPNSDITPYASAALEKELNKLRTTGEGSRNDQLNKAAFALGQLVAGGELEAHDVHDVLTAAARDIGLDPREITATLRSGMNAGAKQPRTTPPLNSSKVTEVLQIGTPEIGSDGEQQRTSWWPQPIGERAAEMAEAQAPTHLRRDDGNALLYAGKVNGIIGESESGKSWIALLAITQALEQGQRVLILDFEDSPASVHRRLVNLGVTPDLLLLVHYADPDESLTIAAKTDLGEALQNIFGVVLVDGVNAALALLGYDLNSNTDATLFSTVLLRPIARTGACVITVDHVPKNPELRGKGGIGAQAKRAMIDGCQLNAEVLEAFGKGQNGTIKLTVDKDRNGHVRGVSGGGKNAGNAEIVSIAETVRITVKAPDLRPAEERDWKPTGVMEQVSKFLERQDRPVGFNTVTAGVYAKEETIRLAIRELEEGGFIGLEDGPRRSVLHSSKAPFRENERLSPTVARLSPGDSEVTVATVAHYTPEGGGRLGDSHGPEATNRNQPSPGDSQIPLDHSSCNQCGEPTPDHIIEETAGYCRRCGRTANP